MNQKRKYTRRIPDMGFCPECPTCGKMLGSRLRQFIQIYMKAYPKVSMAEAIHQAKILSNPYKYKA